MKFEIALLLSLFAGSGSALAHGDHAHDAPPPRAADCKDKECTKDEVAAGVTAKVIPLFVEKKLMDASWKEQKVFSVEKKEFGKVTQWVAVVKNDKVADKAKQTLYVFVTLEGDLAGANHTGK